LTFRWLSQILNRVQRHRCQSAYCLRKKKGSTEYECRFFFPRRPRETAGLIQREGTSWWIFEAKRNDELMNHYVRAISLGWLANIDFSPCTSLQAVINYAGKYCSKSEKKTESYSKLADAVLPKVSHTNPMASFVSKFMNKLIAERDYSSQEVCHILLGLPLQEGSRVVLSVDCRPHDEQSRMLRIREDDVIEAPRAYEKYRARPRRMESVTYFEFLSIWNFTASNSSKWHIYGRDAKPRVLMYYPRYSATPGQYGFDQFCRMKLTLDHPHRHPDELFIVDGHRYDNYVYAFKACYHSDSHQHEDDHYGAYGNSDLQAQEDEFQAEDFEDDLLEEDWMELARQLPNRSLSQEDVDLLGRRDVDINFDWTPFIGKFTDPLILQGDYWNQCRESHPRGQEVEDLPLEARDSLIAEQRVVYDTFIGHFQRNIRTQILLHLDGSGGTGKSFLIKVLSSHLQLEA
jgi:ATP-dependent DNA helicase PIF1